MGLIIKILDIKVKNKNEQFIWAKKEEIIEKYPIPEAFRYYKNKL